MVIQHKLTVISVGLYVSCVVFTDWNVYSFASCYTAARVYPFSNVYLFPSVSILSRLPTFYYLSISGVYRLTNVYIFYSVYTLEILFTYRLTLSLATDNKNLFTIKSDVFRNALNRPEAGS